MCTGRCCGHDSVACREAPLAGVFFFAELAARLRVGDDAGPLADTPPASVVPDDLSDAEADAARVAGAAVFDFAFAGDFFAVVPRFRVVFTPLASTGSTAAELASVAATSFAPGGDSRGMLSSVCETAED